MTMLENDELFDGIFLTNEDDSPSAHINDNEEFLADPLVASWFESHCSLSNIIDIPPDIFSLIDEPTAKAMLRQYGAAVFMRLPEYERVFFQWLSENDNDVWRDLWQDAAVTAENSDTTQTSPYVVSLAFLPRMIDTTRGFPICDLTTLPNFYFVPMFVESDLGKDFISAIKERVLLKEQITIEQLLALEIHLSAIDIWHFAYHHNITIARAKEAVRNLVNDEILLYVTTAEELSNFIDL